MRRHNANRHPRAYAAALIVAVIYGATIGCTKGDRVAVVPVSGKVLLDGQPLAFGAVTFQPMRGQPATGTIQPDGSFKLSTYRENDGAAVGQHHVKITCYRSQDPAVKRSGPNESLGESLVPARYTNFDTSGLTVAVLADGNSPFVFELKSESKDGETAKDADGAVKDTPSDSAKPTTNDAQPASDATKPADESAQSAPGETAVSPEPKASEK